MCVIIIADTRAIPVNMIEDAHSINDDGWGAAWRSGGRVHWVKGMGLKEATLFAETAPLPYVMHARMATVGGKDPLLTHPFPLMRDDPELTLKGSSKRGVLFHNGHLSKWLQVARIMGLQIKGSDKMWSDSRMLACLAARSMESIPLICELESQRVCVFRRDSIATYGDWLMQDGFKVSSRIWCASDLYTHGGVCYSHRPFGNSEQGGIWRKRDDDIKRYDSYKSWVEDRERWRKQEEGEVVQNSRKDAKWNGHLILPHTSDDSFDK